MGLNIAEFLRWQARCRPDAIALVEGDRQLSYAEFDLLAAGCANALHVMGVQPRERVMIALPNSIAWAVIYEGVLQSGAIPVPINPLLATSDIAAIARDCLPALIFDDGRHAAELRQALPEFDVRGQIIDMGVEEAGLSLLPGRLLHPLPTFAPGETAVILYSSGAMGPPKGVELSHFNVWWNVQAFAHDLLGLSEHDCGYAVLPFSHAYAHTCLFSSFLSVGARLVLAPKFDARRCLQDMAREQVSVLMAVPAMFWSLAEAADAPPLPALRACVSGGQALTEPVQRRFEERFDTLISEGYGMTEAGPSITGNRFHADGRRAGSVGLPYWGVELKICDEAGQELPIGQTGEILVRSPGVARGYWNRPAFNMRSFRDGWLHSDDLGHLDADGFLYVVGRRSEVVISGGYHVYPREVEQVLRSLAGVHDAAVLGAPDARLGERVVAFVVAALPLQAEQVAAHCRERIARYKVPRDIRFVDALPRAADGAVDRAALKTLCAGPAPARLLPRAPA